MLDPLPPIPGLKFATQRDLSRPTVGTLDAEFARVWLRKPFMPFQRFIADVAGELDPATGLPARSLVVITGPRQIGKSHMALSGVGQRCMSRPNFRAWYTAQTGGDARDQFLKFNDEVVADTPLERIVRTLRGNGHELMRFPNKSTLRPHPPTEEALHGKQSDRNDIDEAWAFDELEGKQLLQAISPTQLTRPGAQTFIWSAGGTARSTWLANLVARGRAGDPSICYIELGIPDDLPLDDLEAIAAYHPAYGHTITLDSLRNLRTQLEDDAEFARAAGNRWTEVIGGAISAGTWSSVRHPGEIPDAIPLGFGAARAEDGSHVVVAAAAVVDGYVVVEVLDVLPAYGAAAKVKAWAAGDPLAVVPTGPHAGLADDLVKVRTPNLMQLSARDSYAAVEKLLDALPHRGYRFRPSEALDDAVKVAARRRVADGGYAWSRTEAGPSIAALEAATNAAWAVTHRRLGKPRSRHGKAAA